MILLTAVQLRGIHARLKIIQAQARCKRHHLPFQVFQQHEANIQKVAAAAGRIEHGEGRQPIEKLAEQLSAN